MPKMSKLNRILKKIFDSLNSALYISKKYSSAIFSSHIMISPNDSKLNNSSKEEGEYIISDYLIKQTLGQGNFGKVKLGIFLPDKKKYAIKILPKDKIHEKKEYIRIKEIFDMLSKFNHTNVILIEEILESEDNYYCVMEYCEGGDLFDYIMKNRYLSENESAFFYYQLINGLEYIHSLGIVHRDLKPENLLLTKKHILKIIDFGLSNYFDMNEPNYLLSTFCGSPYYSSPEMISMKKYDGFKVDIWATGIILYFMLCGSLPFKDKDKQNLFKKIIECKYTFPEFISKNAKNLINKILVKDPEKRISIAEIKKEPFYRKGKMLYEHLYALDTDFSKYSFTSLNSNDEQEFKITLSKIDISHISKCDISKDLDIKEINRNENLNEINDDLFTLSIEKTFDDLSIIKSKENNDQKLLDNSNKNLLNNENKNKNVFDIGLKKELKSLNFKNKIIFGKKIIKNKIKEKLKLNNNDNNNTKILSSANSGAFKNITHTILNSKNKDKTHESKLKNNLRNKNINNVNKNRICLTNIISPYKPSNNKKYLKTDNNINEKSENHKFINPLINKFNKINHRKINSENQKRTNPIEEYLKKLNSLMIRFNTNIINKKIKNIINTNDKFDKNRDRNRNRNILITKKMKKNHIIYIKGLKKKLNNIHNIDKVDKGGPNNYTKINPILEKIGLNRIKRYNLYNNNLDSNYKKIKGFTNNNSMMKIRKEKVNSLSKNNRNDINNNYFTEIIQNNYYITRNAYLDKTFQKNNNFKDSSSITNSSKNTAFTTNSKHIISNDIFNLKNKLNTQHFDKTKKPWKNSLTIKNSVINLNMVNYNLISSPFNKKPNINKFYYYNTNPISKKINKKKTKELDSNKINDKFNTGNLKLENKIKINKKEVVNNIQNWAKTERNEFLLNKTKNKLEEILRLKNDLLTNKTHIKFNNTIQSCNINKNIKIFKKNTISIRNNPILNKKVINKIIPSRNGMIYPGVHKVKKFKSKIIRNEILNSGKLGSSKRKSILLTVNNI